MTEWKEPVDSAENVFANVTNGLEVLIEFPRLVGNFAFHLTHASPPRAQFIELQPDFLIGKETVLFFESRLGIAGTGQEAVIQINPGTGSWSDLWVKRGTSSFAPAHFERVALPLQDYAGSIVRIRFQYRFIGGTFSQYSGPEHGWIFDDIQIGTDYQIEPQRYQVADLSPQEQQLVEFINRARADAPAEALRLRASTDGDVRAAVEASGVDGDLLVEQFAQLPSRLPPLVPNRPLSVAARLHNIDMLTNDFQGHWSSAYPPPPHQPGDGIAERVNYQGYRFVSVSENAYAFAKSPWHGHAAFNIDWGTNSDTGLSTGGMQNPAGHRLTIHNPVYREIGISFLPGSNTTVGPYVLTQVFALDYFADVPFITGVVWRDLNGNGEYDPSEGLSGLRVDVPGARHYAITTAAGAYAIPVQEDGPYTVILSGAGITQQRHTVNIENRDNLKVDFVLPEDLTILAFSYDVANHRYRLSVLTRAPVHRLRLQQSQDFTSWADRPEMAETGGEPNTYNFSLLPTEVAGRYFRVLLSPP